jgi:competence protein ComEC
MGLGIEGIIAVARLVAAWTPGGGLWGRPDAFAILLLVAGGLWICLWTGRKRWFGVLGLTLGAVGVWLSEPPAMIVDGDGRAVITLDGAGTPHLVGRPGRFALDVWLAALGLEAEKRDLTAGSACDDEACVGEGVDGKVAVIAGPLAFGEECDGAAVVVSALAAPPWCRAGLTLDGPALTASGARLYVRSPSGALVETERVYGTARRPWQVPFDAGRW